MRSIVRLTLVLPALLACGVAAQPANLRGRIEGYVAARQRAIVGELVKLLSVPNVSADTADIRKNADLLVEMLRQRGFAAEVLETKGSPLVYGELRAAGATRTLLIYAHYDGQPVDPSLWEQRSPFVPVLRDKRLDEGGRELPAAETLDRFEPDWRLYARSSADDKAPIVALLAAVDALNSNGLSPTSNLRVVLDGEEEIGSPSLVPAISANRDKLVADALLILDGPGHPSGKATLAFGARGLVSVSLTVYGPRFPLHSGNYGNFAPNPALRLAQLLATFKDDRGRVLVQGFYDGIGELTADEQAMLDAVPDDIAELKRTFGISAAENPEWSLQTALQVPTFNIRGLSSGYVGAEARTIIPDRATAEIDIRLVKETPATAMIEKLRAHVVRQGFHIVASDPDDDTRARYSRIVKLTVGPATEAFRTSPMLPVSRALSDAMTRMFGEPPVRVRTLGGTVPVSQFLAALDCPAVIHSIVNFDNNQHADNENLRIGQFFRGITSIAAVLTM